MINSFQTSVKYHQIFSINFVSNFTATKQQKVVKAKITLLTKDDKIYDVKNGWQYAAQWKTVTAFHDTYYFYSY